MLPGIGTPVKASGRSSNLWTLEFTFTNGTGSVSLDTDQSDVDQRVATPVADGGTGLVSVRFPKCRRVRVMHCSIEEPTPGTAAQHATLCDVSASGGSATFRVVDFAGSLAEGTSGSRGRITLDLDYA